MYMREASVAEHEPIPSDCLSALGSSTHRVLDVGSTVDERRCCAWRAYSSLWPMAYRLWAMTGGCYN
jgi:hypothetical protein